MVGDLDIVALVPARSGSKGVKDKNILPLGGHPLIGFSIIAAKQSELIMSQNRLSQKPVTYHP